MGCVSPKVPEAVEPANQELSESKDLCKIQRMQRGKPGLTEWKAGFRDRTPGTGLTGI